MSIKTPAEIQKDFESIFGNQPYLWNMLKQGVDGTRPGEYRYLHVQSAYQGFCAAYNKQTQSKK